VRGGRTKAKPPLRHVPVITSWHVSEITGGGGSFPQNCSPLTPASSSSSPALAPQSPLLPHPTAPLQKHQHSPSINQTPLISGQATSRGTFHSRTSLWRPSAFAERRFSRRLHQPRRSAVTPRHLATQLRLWSTFGLGSRGSRSDPPPHPERTT